jgi:peptidoglycan/xylan/chitin deacetylase (PgdA/CDA1 family)
MAYLCEKKIKTLTIDDLLSQKSRPEEKAICLTFDDGWSGNYLHAYPILKEYEFTATFFIATELIGRPFYMNWEHLKEMLPYGMSIQSHTVTHRSLAIMDEKQIIFELQKSKETIEKNLGTKVNHLSLPHGSKNNRIWPLAEKIGYQSICTSEIGFQTSGNNGPWLKRINIGDKISEKKFQLITQGKTGLPGVWWLLRI